jgi:exodeoxyribonuclease III
LVSAYRIASWNVAGLRALVKKEPNKLSDICRKYDLDMLCLQETKIQESHLEDPKLKLKDCSPENDGYLGYWSCSTAKKGYSGTAIFVKQPGAKPKKNSVANFFAPKNGSKSSNSAKAEPVELPINSEMLKVEGVSYGIGKSIDDEGRVITVDLPFASIANVYVPNSGQTLQRLDYRTKEWDKDFLGYMQKKQSDRKLPVIWLGDLNVAHTEHDVWNDGAKHLDKQAGVTPQERASFQEQLDSGYADAFRKLHGATSGQYSYWSQRAGNRGPNKGLRLDYFIASQDLFEEKSKVVVRDSYILEEVHGSDHCPVVLELEIKSDKK